MILKDYGREKYKMFLYKEFFIGSEHILSLLGLALTQAFLDTPTKTQDFAQQKSISFSKKLLI